MGGVLRKIERIDLRQQYLCLFEPRVGLSIRFPWAAEAGIIGACNPIPACARRLRLHECARQRNLRRFISWP